MFFETVIPPNVGPGSFSTMKQVMPSSVRAASATMPARSPLVTHVLVPLITYSSPSRRARHEMFRVSLPASGSDSDRHPRGAPCARPGNQRACCSDVPCRMIRLAAIVCVLMMPESDIQPAASSSITAMYACRSRPSPPCSSGIVIPKRPMACICATRSAGYASSCSRSPAIGSTSRSTQRRTPARSSSRVSTSVIVPLRSWRRNLGLRPPCGSAGRPTARTRPRSRRSRAAP